MRFWDSSAIVPLLALQPRTSDVMGLFEDDPAQAVWWATELECTSALARLRRQGSFQSQDQVDEADARLNSLRVAWQEVQPSSEVKSTARRLLRVHQLRTGDALQLASALVASEQRPETLRLVCLDERLRKTARLEGFACLP